MNKIAITIALAVFGTAGLYAQDDTGTKSTSKGPTASMVAGNDHCLVQADEKTWSTLGLNQDQITRVQEIQKRYKSMNADRTTGMTGTTGAERNTTTGTTGQTGTDKHGTTSSGQDPDRAGEARTEHEAMERELRTVLTTAQFDRYTEWCQDHDSSRGDSNTDMDR